MELSLLLIKQIGSMFIMMFFGVLMVRLKVLKPEHGTVISKILLYVVVPCAIISSFLIDFTSEKLAGLGVSVLGVIIVHIIFFALERILRKPLRLIPVEGASLIYANAGNLIMPLIAASLGQEWVFYVSGYLVIEQILLWTQGKSMVCGRRQWDFKSIITNVNIIAIVVGIVFFLTGWRPPSVLQTAMSNTASMMGPLSMILVGMLLGGMNFREIIGSRRAYLISFLRLIAFPAVVILVFCFSGLTKIHAEAANILLVVVLAAASTSATTITQFAQLYDNEPGYTSVVSIMTVIFCIITIPLMIGFYQLLL